MRRQPPVSRKVRSKFGLEPHLKSKGKRAANKSTRRIFKKVDGKELVSPPEVVPQQREFTDDPRTLK